jgi:hypothetical protein
MEASPSARPPPKKKTWRSVLDLLAVRRADFLAVAFALFPAAFFEALLAVFFLLEDFFAAFFLEDFFAAFFDAFFAGFLAVAFFLAAFFFDAELFRAVTVPPPNGLGDTRRVPP